MKAEAFYEFLELVKDIDEFELFNLLLDIELAELAEN